VTDRRTEGKLYFGYGSNLCREDLAAWCRLRDHDPIDLTSVAPGFLPDRRLAFTHRSSTRGGGVLDVPESIGCAVRGVLFSLPSSFAGTLLDRKESEGHTYRRFETMALTEHGSEVPVFAYEVVDAHREPFVAPPERYLEVVRTGYAAHGVTASELECAARGEPHRGAVTGLFVYGTLRQGEERSPVLARHHLVNGMAATTAGTLLDLGPYPGLVLDRKPGAVTGEYYEIPDPAALFPELDRIETFQGFGDPRSLYRRAVVRIERSGHSSTFAWTYVFAGSRNGRPEIVSGDWIKHGRP
jgi:gamma-glutamylcyclotransferase (GGCT)/AIG2-like uncharacterized protein YtfP